LRLAGAAFLVSLSTFAVVTGLGAVHRTHMGECPPTLRRAAASDLKAKLRRRILPGTPWRFGFASGSSS
jgi:hypothetical protein